MRSLSRILKSLAGCAVCGASTVRGQPLALPTANQALFEVRGEERFLVGTVGKPWSSGGFGCVRSGGWQMHEGLDIKCLNRDAHGEPVDPVMATAAGTICYINLKPALSNYGNYLVMRHQIDGLEIFSLYAHLREIRSGLKPGDAVKAGETIGIMGRTTNTREGISKDRAHVHYELNLLLNDRFARWYQEAFPAQRNDHGNWNGQNLLGIDPSLILLEQRHAGSRFNLRAFIQDRKELCRVLVRATRFPWIKRYSSLAERNPAAEREGTEGYEVALDYNGVAFKLIPRTSSELAGTAKFRLLSVNETEYRSNPCRRLVINHGGRWRLTGRGLRLLELLTY